MEHLGEEYKFAYDFMTCVMQVYLPGWHPVPLIPLETIERTFFTQNISRAIRQSLDGQVGFKASTMFDEWFDRRYISMKNFEELAKHLTIEFCMQEYDHLCFLDVCSFLAEFSALTYNYGVIGAPQYAIFCITHILRSLQRYGHWTESTWAELDDFARNMYLM